MTSRATGRKFHFGVFEADEAAGELRKRGIRIKMHAQPFQALIMLLEKPHEVVTREEMRQRLWGTQTFVDFEHGLNTAVNKIRAALDDSASTPRYIETIPGKGYRFVAPVTVHPAPVETSVAQAAVISESPEPEQDAWVGTVLTATHELPAAPRKLVRALLLLVQAMYLAFYLGALANLQEIHDIFSEANFVSPGMLMTVLVTTASVLIPVRLFLFTAVGFNFSQLPQKFGKLFPALLVLDLLWALSPFLLIHHLNTGLALGITAALIYMPFAQRSLVLMYARRQPGGGQSAATNG
jgi:DNA-binding winged helix-turn-helix (wHTH) protein